MHALVVFKQTSIDTSLPTLGQHTPICHVQHHTSLTPGQASGAPSAPSRPPPAPSRHPSPDGCPFTAARHPQALKHMQLSRPTGSLKPRARAGRLVPGALLRLLPCLGIPSCLPFCDSWRRGLPMTCDRLSALKPLNAAKTTDQQFLTTHPTSTGSIRQ
jgi:hypothetical protein